jgi:DNA-binding NarL/FixJ family response regulator
VITIQPQHLTVLLVDSHDGVRKVLASRLNALPGFELVGETASPAHGMELAEKLHPGVLLFDCNTPGTYASQLVSRIRRASPGSLLVVFTSFLTPDEEEAYLAAGADGCLLKGLAIGELAATLQEMAAGKHSVDGHKPARRTRRSD